MVEALMDMARYGKPFLFLTSHGWRCSIEMNINISGAKFEVLDKGDCPESAVANCHSKMLSALTQLSSLRSNPMLPIK